MNKITFPIRPGMQGPAVADLQAALQLCLDRGAILVNNESMRQALSEELQHERHAQTYNDVTIKSVSIFQGERGLRRNGEVDEPTANALNTLLKELGAFDQEPAPRSRIVNGAVRREDGLPLQGLRVRAAHEAERRSIRLGEDITDAEGRYTIRYELLPGVDAINLSVSAIGDDGRTLVSSEEVRNAKPLETIDLTVPVTTAPVNLQRIEGTIVLEHGLPAEKLKLRLYRRDFGGKVTLLGEATTLAGGRYAFAYDPDGQAASLEVRAITGDGKEILLSKPLNTLTPEARSSLNLVAPGRLQPLVAEYRRLLADLAPQVGQMAKLADAKENAEQQDLTVLNRATGWDARLIALASVTERLAADPNVGLSSEALYGLLRAGLPSDKLLLAQVEPDVVDMALKKVRDAGIVDVTDAAIADIKTKFTAFAHKTRLTMPAPGSRSTYGELLKASGLDDDAQARFATVYLRHRGNGAQLWDEARRAGLDDAQIGKLQLQGKLAFLAGNSEAMTTRLLNKGLKDPVELVGQDFQGAATWKNEVLDQAGIPQDRRNNLTDADRKKLETVIPVAYAAEKVEARLEAYAEDMARKVRLSYPTQVLGRLMETNEKFKLSAAHHTTVTLLKNAAAQGFRFGETPVAAFLKSHPGVQAGMSDTEFDAAGQQMKVLQRVYQITPSNEAMPVLMSLGMTSAYDVMAYPETQFMALFDAKYLEIYMRPAPSGMAALVRRKGKQVSSVTYNLFTIAKKLESEPPVAGLSASVQVRESVKNELIKHFPTMESLFGSMDFCECEHCRSVLSPAAYLVDLLQFVDTEPGVWGNFLARWKATHGNQDYPHKDKNGNPMKPYDVLNERRPDLPHISLTCENTHTVLPYIDIVNEILEYYVAYGKLEGETAHDTGDATTEELLAEPQNVIREAYDTLRAARYPITLPFDLWIETVRQFCNYFETPLHRVLEVLRPGDDLFASAQTFDRAAIFMESLGLSPADVAIFTDSDPLANWHKLYGFASAADATTEATDATTGQRIDLNSAKALSRRIGVTYKEIAEIVQTGFVNPELSKLSLLYKLGVSVRDAKLYKDEKAFYEANKDLLGKDRSTLPHADQQRFDDLAKKRPNEEITGWQVVNEVAAFEQRLTDLPKAFKPPLNVSDLRTAIRAIRFNRVLVLADPDAGCNFDLTTLQCSDGTKADGTVFLRINLFVRLWRTLGWSIEEVDRALTTFIPSTAPFDKDAPNLAKQPLKTALIYLAHLKALDEKLKVGKQSRLKLLTLWSDIATTGKKPLYAQLFLNRSVLKSAPVFDHPLGQYLTDPNINLKDHVLALQGALGLTADEIGRILVDAGKVIDTAELSLPHVSLLYRYGLLAKVLKLSVRELIALKQLSGLDPFKQLDPNPLAILDQDHPFSQTLEFVKVAEEVKGSGLKIEDLDYLLRHRFDETGKYRPNREGTLALLKMLAEGVRAIRAEHAVPDDPGALSDEVLRQKLGLVLPPDVVERFLGMVNTTIEFTATKPGVNAVDKFSPSTFATEKRIREVSYKEVPHKEQKLTVRGVLFNPEKTAMKTSFDPMLTAPQKSAFAELLDGVQGIAREFFDNQLKKQKLRLDGEAGFLEEADFAELFAPLEPLKEIRLNDTQAEVDFKQSENEKIEKKNREELQERRKRIAQAFLPFLQQRLIRQFIVQTMTAQTGADPALVESLLTDERVLAVVAKPLLKSLADTVERGVSAVFFDSVDGTGQPRAAGPLVSSVDMALKDRKDKNGNPLNPVNSARFDGYLEVPATGAYRFYVELDKQNAEAELRFPHRPEPVFLKGAAAADHATLGEQPGEFLELKAGVLYCFSLDLKKLNGGEARLLVRGETLPKGPMSQLTLYPAAAIDAAERAAVLLNKALQLVQSLGLSEREIRYLLTHAADFDNVSLSDLPTGTVGHTPTEKTATEQRFTRFRRLVAYALLKRDLAGGTDDLIGIFEANGTTAADRLEKQVYPLIAKLTRRDKATVKASAEALVKVPAVPAFESEKPLWRLWEALQVIERFGVSPASLLGWADIANNATTADRRFEIARDLKEAIKARFEPESWQRVAQPIFDKLRQRQRDALVSHVMQHHGFDHMEQLYEYFLIDPGMEPVVQTSRIRLAISSLQLFIQRCLLNLEPMVHPSTINAKQWEWMKRYRVWEANRKIFLFPENWLEPEFRDDKTHLFTELEGALLQGDVSSDLVEDAFLNYLKKLDELARLDIVAMHIEDNSGPARRTLHVFGRTYSQPHKYFYRRYAHQMWTTWEPVSAEIEGDHLAPVVWRDRLYLFWVTFMDQPPENPPQPTGKAADQELIHSTLSEAVSSMQAMVAEKKVEVQLHWSEYLQGEWSTRESGGFSPLSGWDFLDPGLSTTMPATFKPSDVFIHVSKEYDPADDAELGVFINMMGGASDSTFYLTGCNSAPELKLKLSWSKLKNPFSANTEIVTRYSGSGALKVSYDAPQITTEPGKTPPKANLSILQQGSGYSLLPCNNNLSTLGVSEDAYRNAADPAAVKAAIESGLAEIASLIKPVFYQDNRHTLFVEPNVTERTIKEWQDWVTRTPQPEPGRREPDWWKKIVVIPETSRRWPIPDPGDPWRLSIHSGSLINPIPDRDWLVNPGTAIKFDDSLIGPAGQPGIEIVTAVDAAAGYGRLSVNPGSDLAGGRTVVLSDENTFAKSGLKAIGGGLNIVGSAGFNSALEQSFSNLNRSGFGATVPAAGRIER
ncbi:neuraminidase-like domain-containing protein [Candidatus Methylomirabilis sp.]|uniref:neuraminidase-like domain-containing protein n=1 Tax=Candidatus Methylomirabilis sp. TaxID=2032687 RepID=UPI003076093C